MDCATVGLEIVLMDILLVTMSTVLLDALWIILVLDFEETYYL